MQRLFVSIPIPEAVADALASLMFGLPGARWTSRDQLHVTLAFIGEIDGALAADVREALREVRSPEFELSLRGVGHFPPRGEPRVAWAGIRASEPLAHLARSVERALDRAGCEIEKRKFHAHVTLARLRETPSRRLAEWLAINGLFELAPFPVTEFALFSSVLQGSGAIHRVEEIYPLARGVGGAISED